MVQPPYDPFGIFDRTKSFNPQVQYQRITVTGTEGVAIWDYTTGYPETGPIPMVWSQPVVTGTAPNPIYACMYETPTRKQAKFRVYRGIPTTLPGTVTAILGTVIKDYEYAPAGTELNVLAMVLTECNPN